MRATIRIAAVLSAVGLSLRIAGAEGATPSGATAAAMMPAAPAATTPVAGPLKAVRLAPSDGGIGFDDLGYSPRLRKVLVPAGGAGRIDLVDPDSLAVKPIVLGAGRAYKGGHGEGVTSVDSDGSRLFAADRTSKRVLVVDATIGKVLGSAALSGHPDYVRWVGTTRELWVTEPNEEKIEIFALKSGDVPAAAGAIHIAGGPESLVIDDKGGRAFTHLWEGITVSVDLRERGVLGRWPNGCQGSRGIAFDERDGIVFAACAEGKLVTLDANHQGRKLASLDAGRGVDVISYDPKLRRAYVPGAESADLTVIDVSATGQLTKHRVAVTAKGAHCVTADDRGHAWVCDPIHGQLLLLDDVRP